MAVSDVILGRLSHVPIVTIAVPIVVHATARSAGVAGGSLDLSKFERFVDDFRTLADAHDHHPRSARSRDLHQRRRRVHRAAEPRRRIALVRDSAQAEQAASTAIERPIAGAARGLGAHRRVGADAVARLEGLHRAAAADAAAAVDRLLRADARADAAGARRRGARRARLRRRGDAAARGSGHRRPQHLGARRPGRGAARRRTRRRKSRSCSRTSTACRRASPTRTSSSNRR